jgi:hypothetical protein
MTNQQCEHLTVGHHTWDYTKMQNPQKLLSY